MSMTEVKSNISQLPSSETADLAQWFEGLPADGWDRQIAQDAKAGRFDALLKRVNEQAEAGQCRAL